MKLRSKQRTCHHLNNNGSHCRPNGKQMQESSCVDMFLLELALVCNLQVVSLHKPFSVLDASFTLACVQLMLASH